MVSIEVVCVAGGWRLSAPDRHEVFATRSVAMQAAMRLAQLTRWRGGRVVFRAQEAPEAPLKEIGANERSALS